MKSMLRKVYRSVRKKIYRAKIASAVAALPDAPPFKYGTFKSDALRFLHSLKAGDQIYLFKYSAQTSQPTLYSSAYALMTLSLLGEADKLSSADKASWAGYFDSFQKDDGLFYDPVVANQHYNDSDWWGARHLALHMISAYTHLGHKPKYQFRFLRKYYDTAFLDQWLTENGKHFEGDMENDFDNKVMNVSCLLQYQRDTWADPEAAAAVAHIQTRLMGRLNPETGMWGDSRIDDRDILSRKVQFAYHLLPVFFYDNIAIPNRDKLLVNVLATQNRFGGFGVPANSSACEDIDSIDILIRLSEPESVPGLKEKLSLALAWNLRNQMPDGGFVFRLNESFEYGHSEMSSASNMGAIFPTWFRTLSIAYLCRYLQIENEFRITRCPGYEF